MKTSKPTLDANEAEQARKRARLRDVEKSIASLYDGTRDTNQFRFLATISFGVLVFIVVGGFYLIAWNKEGIAKTIFAGELGMQFVTLFLIVIAIILFGIMGTLEGKNSPLSLEVYQAIFSAEPGRPSAAKLHPQIRPRRKRRLTIRKPRSP